MCEQEVPEIVIVVALADEQRGVGRDIAHEADAHGVVAALQAFEDKPARLVGQLTADGHAITKYGYRRKRYRSAAGGIDCAPRDSHIFLRMSRRGERTNSAIAGLMLPYSICPHVNGRSS
jgi:hypothetical protein